MSASHSIRAAVTSWPGVTEREHRFGGCEFNYGRVELGHIHGDRLADLPFPRRVRDELVAAGRARPHHVLPDTGWVSKFITEDGDVDDVIALFRLNYDRVATRRSQRTGEGRSG